MAGAPPVHTLTPVGHEVRITTAGDGVVLDFMYPRNTPVAALHCHPQQTEYVTVAKGTFGFWIDGTTSSVDAAKGAFEIPKGVWHRFWLEGPGPHELKLELRPRLRTAQFFERWFDPSNQTRVDQQTGFPAGWFGARLAAAHTSEFEFVHPWLMPFVRFLGVFVDDRRRFQISQSLLSIAGFGAMGASTLILLLRIASAGCSESLRMPAALRELLCVPELVPAEPDMSAWNLIIEIIRFPASAMAAFAGLLLLGIALLGWWRVRDRQRETIEAGKPDDPSTERRVKSLRKRFWYDGTDLFPSGVRAAYLVPLSLTVWLGIMRAAEFVSSKINASTSSDALLSSKWTIVLVLIIAVSLAWTILWPGEPEDDSFRLSDEERDKFTNSIRERAVQWVKDEYDARVATIEANVLRVDLAAERAGSAISELRRSQTPVQPEAEPVPNMAAQKRGRPPKDGRSN